MAGMTYEIREFFTIKRKMQAVQVGDGPFKQLNCLFAAGCGFVLHWERILSTCLTLIGASLSRTYRISDRMQMVV